MQQIRSAQMAATTVVVSGTIWELLLKEESTSYGMNGQYLRVDESLKRVVNLLK